MHPIAPIDIERPRTITYLGMLKFSKLVNLSIANLPVFLNEVLKVHSSPFLSR
jgi:hypothetical protein